MTRCVRTAGENAERNGVAENFKVLVGDLSDKASGQYNIITANIVAAAILSLAPHVPVLMAPGARFIASGIIDERREGGHYRPEGRGSGAGRGQERSAAGSASSARRKRRKPCRIVILRGSWPTAAPH